MKITVFNAEPEDMHRVASLVNTYRKAGYADGSRTKHRQCVLYVPHGSSRPHAHVWGGPEHIRVMFDSPERFELRVSA